MSAEAVEAELMDPHDPGDPDLPWHTSPVPPARPVPDTTRDAMMPATIPAATPGALGAALPWHDKDALGAMLASYTDARKVFVAWILEHLIPGVDYQALHRKIGQGRDKKPCPNAADRGMRYCPKCEARASLCKPGSEKICGMLRLRPRFRRDADTWEMAGSPAGLICLVCELVALDGTVVAEGRAMRPLVADAGWSPATVPDSPYVPVAGADPNKTVKMAQKSAQTDAVLRVGGLSEVFTQDLEDLPGAGGDDGKARDDRPGTPRRASETGSTATRETPATTGREPGDDDASDGDPREDARPATLGDQLQDSIDLAAEMREGQVGRAPARTRAEVAAETATGSRRETVPLDPVPDDAISPARLRRLYALMHERIWAINPDPSATDGAGMFESMRTAVKNHVLLRYKRHHLAHLSWKNYEEVCEAVQRGDFDPGDGRRTHARRVRR